MKYLVAAISITIAASTFSIPVSYAHSGGTDNQGCHTNSQTGQRHCH